MSTRRIRGSRRGGVLIATLVLVMTIAGVAACLFQLDSTRARRQVASVDNKRAFNVAEAGLAEAFYGLTVGKTGAVGSQAEPAGFGGGLFWVEATDLGDGLIGLESVGMYGSGRATLSLVVRRAPDSIAALGVLGSNEVVLGLGAQIDAYDSRGGAVPDGSLRVQSNGDISVGADSTIVGDANPGPEGVLLLGEGASVLGSTAPNACEVDLPAIEVPEFDSLGDVNHASTRPLVLRGEQQAYGDFVVASNAQVTIQGPADVVVGALTVANAGTLGFDTTNGPVTLYVNDWLNLPSGSLLAFSSTNPADVSVLVNATGNVDRDGDGKADPAVRWLCAPPYYGTLYAPLASVTLPAKFVLSGTVSARKLTLDAGAQVHFDIALDAAGDEAAGTVERLSWRIVDIPVEIARSLSTNPFEVLGVAEAALVPPVEAHLDVGFQIHVWYTDASNAVLTYRGPESGFDWGNVKAVSKILRQPL